MTTVSAEQYRIEQVQILNWGGYCGLQVMRAGRGSTAILGPSGRGKSTLGGDTALVPGVAHRPVRTHQAGTVAAMLDITAGPYQGWLSEELQRFTYLCVEKDTDLEGPRPDGVVGRVTRAGLRTAPNRRVIKADTPRRYRWVGRDNSALRAELDDDLAGLQRQFDDISRRVEIARGTTRTGQARIGELEQIQKDLSWTDLDLEPTTRRLATLADALDRVDTPEQQVRRDAYKLARQQVTGAEGAATKCQDRVQHLNLLWGAVQRAQDSANDVIDAHDPLTADEQAAAASLPFAAPALERVDLTGRDVDAKTDAAVQASYHEAARVLEDQIAAHDAARATHERTLLVIIQAYRNINDRTHREVDDTIESLPTLEHIHQQLVTDDLPRARKNWLAKVVPVPGMHTKWLARHRGMVLACLGTPTDSSESTESTGDADPVDIPADDLDALGLRPLPREISVILADPVLRAAVGGLRQISAPVDELAGLQIRPDAILIVENKEPALAWSDTAGLVVIHSLGNHLDVLSRLPWIRHDHCWYWGDLDRHGFTLLSRARSMISRLRSLLMASGAIEAYRPLGVEEDLDRYDQPDSTLTLAEASALAALELTGGKYLRIEQERILVSDAQYALEEARNLVAPDFTEVPGHGQ